MQFGFQWNIVRGVIPSGAVLQAKREPALSEAEGDLARIATCRQYQKRARSATGKPRAASRLLYRRLQILRRAMPPQQLRQILRKRRPRHHDVGAGFLRLLLQFTLHMR